MCLRQPCSDSKPGPSSGTIAATGLPRLVNTTRCTLPLATSSISSRLRGLNSVTPIVFSLVVVIPSPLNGPYHLDHHRSSPPPAATLATHQFSHAPHNGGGATS